MHRAPIICSAKEKNTMMNTVPTIFKQTVAENSSRVALRTKEFGLWHDITWDEYFAMVKKVGCALTSMGLKPGQSVCIIGDNSVEWVAADLRRSVRGRHLSRDLCHQRLAPGGVCGQPQLMPGFCLLENEEQLDKWADVQG